jgi:uncharacterized protein
MWDTLLNIAVESWGVLGQMAPYLLLGFLVAGILSVCVSPAWVERHLGRRGFRPVLTASLVGVPLPLCSCGVIPVAASIRRHGASRGATSAFLISTPQTSVVSVAVTYAMLGGVFAVFRLVAAAVTGVVGGLFVQLLGAPRTSEDSSGEAAPPACTESCCTEQDKGNIVLRALEYGFVTLPRDIGRPLLVGVLVAGVIAALVPPGQLAPYLGGGLPAILAMMLASLPIYVCGTASVPIAVGLIHAGVSPGAALAFLIAGPATNAATISVAWRLLGRRTTVVYLVAIGLSAVASGLMLDAIYTHTPAAVPHLGAHDHVHDATAWSLHAWAVALLVVLAWSFWSGRNAAGGTPVEGAAPAEGGPAGRVELAIGGMTCSHCVQTIQRALARQPGVRSAEVDLAQGRAVVVGVGLDSGRLADEVRALGYAAEPRGDGG